MMDRKTMLVVLGCLVAMIGWQAVINHLYPPKPKAIKVAAAVTTNNAAPQAATESPAEKPVEPAKEAAFIPEDHSSPEQTITLSNELVRMEFTSWGGGMRSVELLKHKVNDSSNVVLNGTNFVPALTLLGITNAGPNSVFTIEQPAPNTVVMKRQTREGLGITKTFSLGDGFLLTGTVEIARIARGSVSLPASADLVIGTVAPTTAKELPTYLTMGWLPGDKYQYHDLKQIAKNADKGISSEQVAARWGAVKNQFFAMILTPETNAIAIEYKQVDLAPPADWKAKEPPHGVFAALTITPTTTTTNVMERYDFTWYAGPKAYERLVALGKGQEEVMQFGFWGVISVALLKSMKFFHGLIPSYGVAIILVTICIKILFWPIQAKSIKSMKAMQKFQPLINKLKEKYKDDPQRLNAETMKLYKEHKINPVAGCLPMVVQIPVLFAFYRMLASAIELRGQSFLWIHDLSMPDTIFTVAGLGLPINPLPLLMTGLSVWQMKITPQTGDQQQQKMMMFMPLMMMFIFYKLAAGVVLYYTVQQFLSIAQQWLSMRKADNAASATPLAPAGKVK
jgi:YidC/Oxa1 family membrane protein insertase